MRMRVLPTSGDKRYYMEAVRLLELFGSGSRMYRKSAELCGGKQDRFFYLFAGRLIDVCLEGF
jgi:hypothetical protein